MQDTFDLLSARLATSGLRILHSGPPVGNPTDTATGDSTDIWPGPGMTVKSVLIIGHVGSEFWPYFCDSPEYRDGQDHPLDRWSRRTIQAAAADMAFVSPNDGPPYPPLHALTRGGDGGGALHPSPLGMLVHAQFGLWVAIRGLLLSQVALPATQALPAPPASAFQDCFAACPVGAFSDEGYDAVACARHLLQNTKAACWSGCLARQACTVGQDRTYDRDHARFYMDAFTKAMQRRGV